MAAAVCAFLMRWIRDAFCDMTRHPTTRRNAMKLSKFILTLSFVAASAIIPCRTLYAQATTHSGEFSLPLAPPEPIILYTDNGQRYIVLTVCNDKSSAVPVQISADGRTVLDVAASNCGKLLVNAVTLSIDVFAPGRATGTYSVTVLGEFRAV